MTKAVLIFSGGLDSATCLAYAQSKGYEIYALTFQYGQKAQAEVLAASQFAKARGVLAHQILNLDLSQFGGSALTDDKLAIPSERPENDEIPITYVPARNTIFLSLALGYAEVLGADAIFYGANFHDYSNYPDCTPDYIEKFEALAKVGTKAGQTGQGIRIHAPLLKLRKHEIIALGHTLGVDFSKTVSCYQADAEGLACGTCASCQIRAEGFRQSSVPDTTRYAIKIT